MRAKFPSVKFVILWAEKLTRAGAVIGCKGQSPHVMVLVTRFCAKIYCEVGPTAKS